MVVAARHLSVGLLSRQAASRSPATARTPSAVNKPLPRQPGCHADAFVQPVAGYVAPACEARERRRRRRRDCPSAQQQASGSRPAERSRWTSSRSRGGRFPTTRGSGRSNRPRSCAAERNAPANSESRRIRRPHRPGRLLSRPRASCRQRLNRESRTLDRRRPQWCAPEQTHVRSSSDRRDGTLLDRLPYPRQRQARRLAGGRCVSSLSGRHAGIGGPSLVAARFHDVRSASGQAPHGTSTRICMTTALGCT
jgi:hypothetical protein